MEQPRRPATAGCGICTPRLLSSGAQSTTTTGDRVTFASHCYARDRFYPLFVGLLSFLLVFPLVGQAPAAWADHQSVPTGLQATGSYEAVYLDWDPQGGDVTYDVFQSTDGETFQLIRSSVQYSEAPIYELVNGTTYHFYVRARHGDLLSDPSATVTATADAGASDEWARCDQDVQQRCVVETLLDGEPAPDHIAARISDSGVLQWQWVFVDASGHSSYDLIADGGLTANSTLTLVLDLGREAIGTLTSTGLVERLSETTDDQGDTILTIVASPARASWLRNGCHTDACGDETTRADDDREGMLIGAVPVRDAIELDEAAGSWIASNAQAMTHPWYDHSTEAFHFEVAAPHLMSDGETPNGGFFVAFLTDLALSGYWGIQDSSTLSSGHFSTHRTDGDQTSEVYPTVTPVDGGVMIELHDFTYSTPAFAISTATGPDGDGDGVPDDRDNCVDVANPRQTDTDGDGQGDACDPDDDGDGVADGDDAFPLDRSETTDSDGDGVGDNGDNCPAAANADQADTDADGAGDACDADTDAPVWPEAASVSTDATTSTGFTVSWPAASDDYSVEKYTVTIDGALTATVTDTSYTASGVGSDTSYDLAVRAVDAAGNASAPLVTTVTTEPSTGGGYTPPPSSDRDPEEGPGADPEQEEKTSPPAYDGEGERGLAYACPDGADANYGDVDDTDVHFAGIGCASRWQLFEGRSDGTFAPAVELRRGQLASVLVRAIEGILDESLPPGSDRFSDDDGSVHAAAIEKLAETGIVGGYGDGTFGPTDSISRGQFAAMLVRAYEYLAGELPTSAENHFSDDDGTAHEASLNALRDLGVLIGDGDQKIQPNLILNRAQAATMVARLMDALVEEDAATAPAA